MDRYVLFLYLSAILILISAQTVGATDLTFQYDGNGNLISDGGKYYEYDDGNHLVRVRHGSSTGNVIAEYFYDHQGQRVKKIENGITTYYIGKRYETQVVNGEAQGSIYYFANGERVARKDSSGNVFYYHSDHLGGTNVITDASGNLVERTRYYPFGEIREGGTEKYTYTGKEKDALTSQYYFEARYYAPNRFQFTQADTVEPNLYDPQDLNVYAYARNNPIKYIDPTGHTWWKPWTWFRKQNNQQTPSTNGQPAQNFSEMEIANQTLTYGTDVSVHVAKDIVKSGAKGINWAFKQGYRDFASIQGASKGAIKATLGGTKIMRSIGDATGGYFVDKLLDRIEGSEGETISFLSGPYGVGKVFFRYHKAGVKDEAQWYNEFIMQHPDYVPPVINTNSQGEN